ncbi:MAG: DUF2703 domain-containing protein [bacterium]
MSKNNQSQRCECNIPEKEELNISEFKQDPLQSNRIWINQQPLENFIKGEIGQSPCCDLCGSPDCRTIEIKEKI